MTEVNIIGFTWFGMDEYSQSLRMAARLFPKPNIEVSQFKAGNIIA